MQAVYKSTYTPTEQEAVNAHRARQQRIAEAGRRRPEPPTSRTRPFSPTPDPTEIERVLVPETIEDWVQRQKAKYKAPWFFVAADLGTVEGTGPSVPQIQRAVCLHYGVSLEDMLSPARFAGISLPRQVAVYICRRLTKRGYPELGKRFGDRDHSTQIHACRRISDLIKTDPVVASAVEQIIESLGGGT